MHVLSYLRTALKKNLREREEGSTSRAGTSDDGDWDFGARQSPDSTMRTFTFPRPSKPAKSIPPALVASSPSSPHPYRSRSATPLREHHTARPSSEASHRVNREFGTPSLANMYRASEKRKPATSQSSVGNGSVETLPEAEVTRDLPLDDDKFPNSSDAPPSPFITYEGFVLVAAAASARESRKSISSNREGFAERRRKAHSIAAARLIDPTKRPMLRHASSAYTIYETPDASSSKAAASVQAAPSSSDFGRASPKRASVRRTMLQSKRSLPLLHNVWENFLQETSEDDIVGGSTEVSRENSGSSKRTIRNGADLSLHSGRQNWRPDHPHPPLPRHLQSPSASSKLTVSTVASSELSPNQSPTEANESVSIASPSKSANSSVYLSPSRMTMLQRRSRIQGRGRGSVQTASSEATVSSVSSSGYSIAGFSSTSSVTSAEVDEPEAGKDDANHPYGSHSRGETQSSESNSASDFSSSYRSWSPHENSSSGSIPSSSRFRNLNITTPHTPSRTPNMTTSSLPPTPPLSRSSSRSRSPRSTPKLSGQLSPGSSLPSTPLANSHASVQWRGASPPIIPKHHSVDPHNPYSNFNDLPCVPSSSKGFGINRVPSSSDSSDACSTGEDILSELEYYYPRRRSPGPRRHVGLPATPVPTQRLRLAEQAVPRSKSTSNIRLVSRAERESQLRGAPNHKGYSPSPASFTRENLPSPGNVPNTSPASRGHRRSGSNNDMSTPNESTARSAKAAFFPSQSLPPSPTPISSFPSYTKNGAGPRFSEMRMSHRRRYEGLPDSAVSTSVTSTSLSRGSPAPAMTRVVDSARQLRGTPDLLRPPSRPGTGSSANVEWGYAL